MKDDSLVPRLAAPRDARRIAQVHVRARQAAYRGLIPWSILGTESVDDREIRWRKRLSHPEGRCWLMSDRVGLFGFAYTAPSVDADLDGRCAELYSLYLLAEEVGHGFGRLLMAHALGDLEERGYPEVVLWYAEENARAAHFYEAAGFEIDPRVERIPFGDTGLHRRRLRKLLRET